MIALYFYLYINEYIKYFIQLDLRVSEKHIKNMEINCDLTIQKLYQ